ncbi:MAG: cytochrome c family protein [Proteobacteria bacterium]|nr:cytochrome c3 family protein [Desulfobulbaceae bacterium]MBU4154345.1 cytochrome c family protein [Pseudomonadota bacterium]
MKSRVFLGSLIVGGIFLATGSSMAADEKGKETITLKGGIEGSITFPHGRHQSMFVDCKPCHDVFPKEAHVLDKMMAEGKMQKKVVMDMCKKCHADLAAKGQKAGPTACKGCHQK